LDLDVTKIFEISGDGQYPSIANGRFLDASSDLHWRELAPSFGRSQNPPSPIAIVGRAGVDEYCQ